MTIKQITKLKEGDIITQIRKTCAIPEIGEIFKVTKIDRINAPYKEYERIGILHNLLNNVGFMKLLYKFKFYTKNNINITFEIQNIRNQSISYINGEGLFESFKLKESI